jgi:hypothetical protein
VNAVDGKEERAGKERKIMECAKENIVSAFPHPKKAITYQLSLARRERFAAASGRSDPLRSRSAFSSTDWRFHFVSTCTRLPQAAANTPSPLTQRQIH